MPLGPADTPLGENEARVSVSYPGPASAARNRVLLAMQRAGFQVARDDSFAPALYFAGRVPVRAELRADLPWYFFAADALLLGKLSKAPAPSAVGMGGSIVFEDGQATAILRPIQGALPPTAEAVTAFGNSLAASLWTGKYARSGKLTARELQLARGLGLIKPAPSATSKATSALAGLEQTAVTLGKIWLASKLLDAFEKGRRR
jgi:hypothetical protein